MLNKSLGGFSSFVMAFVLLWAAGCSNDPTGPDNSTVPVLTTSAVSAITQTTAYCGGAITSDGGATVTARGVCWSADSTPTVDGNKTTDGTGRTFSSMITGLTASTCYFVRAYATNSAGTGYGSETRFVTASWGTVSDIDGNAYKTVTIGTQVWMAENLKVTHYRNNEAIPIVTGDVTWSELYTRATGACCSYDNSVDNVTTYGRLYNGFAVTDGRSIAPLGWHVPTDAEWRTLVDYLGGYQYAANKMKEVGYWCVPCTSITNESGFSALPSGYRSGSGDYLCLGDMAHFWCSMDSTGFSAWFYFLNYMAEGIGFNLDSKLCGFSIRCVKD